MKKSVKMGILLGLSIVCTAYAYTPVSKEYVDQTFGAIQQTLTAMQQQLGHVSDNGNGN